MNKFSKVGCTLAGTVLAFGLAACGDDITEQINANVGAVETSKDLPECTKDIAGQTAFVSETHEFLGCDGKEWQTLSANTVSVGDNVCTSTSLSDGTGFEIFCNGASIGTVRNGKDGEKGDKGDTGDKGADGAPGTNGTNGKDGAPGTNGTNGTNGKDGAPGTNGTGCKIQESTELTATIACGSETFTMDLTGYVNVPEECDATDDACTVPSGDVELSGVSQKGPFVSGTDVTAYELENGKSLKQTGKTFGGKIENKDGSFNIRTVKLRSTYTYLVADGFYRNEVTGKNSAATIKLRALTNLDGRSTANINLVTHLEYDRVQRLVTKENMAVLAAKRAAEGSLFAAFGIDNSGFGDYAEDLNILEEGDGNAALLAVSVLLQGDRNESELTALLAALSVDLGDNGVWDDSLHRAQIADWAMKADIEGRLAKIRANVEGWKLVDSKAPAFEGHVTNFWTEELGVGDCGSDNDGMLFATKNKFSSFYAANDSAFTAGDSSLVRLICDASGTAPAWRFATEIEKDTAGLSAEAGEGTATYGKVNTNRVYVKDGAWRRGTQLDLDLNASCVTSVKEHTTFSAVSTDTTWYICADNGSKLDGYTVPISWRKATETEADTAQFGIPETAADSIKRGHVNRGRYFVYEKDEWRRGTDNDVLLGKACLASIKNAIVQDSAGRYFTCTGEAKLMFDGVTVPTTWRASTSTEADTYGWDVSSNMVDSVKLGNIDKSHVYVYEVSGTTGAWRRGTDLDLDKKLGTCINTRRDTVRQKKDATGLEGWYKCVTDEDEFADGERIPSVWRKATDFERDTYGWGAADNGTLRENEVSKLQYVYDNGWRPATDLEQKSSLGACVYADSGSIRNSSDSDDSWYKCSNEIPTTVDGVKVQYTWIKASNTEADTANLGDGFDLQSGMVFKGHLKAPKDNYYKYTGSSWDTASTVEMDTHDPETHLPWSSGNDGDYRAGTVHSNLYYVYDAYMRKWRPETSEYDHDPELKGCTVSLSEEWHGYSQGTVVKKNSNGTYYYCRDTVWVVASQARWDTYGKPSCNRSNAVTYGIVNLDYVYVCEADTFRTLTPDEQWSRNYSASRNFVRCTEADQYESFLLQDPWTKYYCVDGHYVWDGEPSFAGLGYVKVGSELINIYTHDDSTNTWTREKIAREGSDSINISIYGIGTQIWAQENMPPINGKGFYIEGVNRAAGGFFTFEEAQSICENIQIDTTPKHYFYSGIHKFRLPSKKDWEILLANIGLNEGEKFYDLKANNIAQYLFKEGGQKNDYYKFSAIPGGEVRDYGDGTEEILRNGEMYWWTSEGGQILTTPGRTDIGYYPYGTSDTLSRVGVRCIANGSVDLPPPYNRDPIETLLFSKPDWYYY